MASASKGCLPAYVFTGLGASGMALPYLAGGAFGGVEPDRKSGYFYEFLHKYVRNVRSKTFFWAKLGADRGFSCMLSN